MVKFSKQFEAQLVPEWKEAFVDYLELKKDLKQFHLLNTTPSPPKEQEHHASLVTTFFSLLRKFSPFRPKHRNHHGAIQVHKKLASSARNGDMYETEMLEQFADTDAAKEFFTCLDLQLNKVNQFYRMKEKEFVERGESMKKQLEILIELKTALNQKNGRGDSKEDASISCTISSEQDHIQESEVMQYSDSTPRSNEVEKSMKLKREDSRLKNISSHVFNIQGKNLRINVPLTTPSRTFSAISYLIWGDFVDHSTKKSDPVTRKLHFNRKKVHQAEKMIKEALIELYKGLSYLKTFRHLNMLAFIKILKKFDKVTGKEILPIYLKVVETSYFNSSDKVMNLLDEVEERFVKEFSEDDRRKAMKYLRPRQHKDSHSSSFFTGLFTGCFIALLAGYIIMAHITGMYRIQPDTVYMETVFSVLSIFGLLFLHLFLYGCNIFVWRKARINYSFILELALTKELKYRDVFLICTTSMTAVIGVLFIHLSLISKGYSYNHVKAIPGFLLLIFLLLLICPFNVFYRSSRYRFIRVIRNIILSPLYKVVMLDFFMADQLCSQIPMLQNLEYVICYYLTGSYKTQDYQHCKTTGYYKDLAYAVSFLPYYWRAMQCARRWFDEGKTSHLVNLGKYVSAMLAAGVKVAYEKNEKTAGWMFLLVVISTAATMYQLYWDFVKDWGLLQINSKNPWLRNKLMLRRKFIYYLSMVLNMILRLAWLQTILHSNFEHVDYRVTRLFLAALEVIRRGLWNFYRLENEHLHNAGKFRAVDNVPLPFHEVDEED